MTVALATNITDSLALQAINLSLPCGQPITEDFLKEYDRRLSAALKIIEAESDGELCYEYSTLALHSWATPAETAAYLADLNSLAHPDVEVSVGRGGSEGLSIHLRAITSPRGGFTGRFVSLAERGTL